NLFMPVGWNILTTFGIGPIVLRDVGILNLNAPPSLPAWFWIAVTTVSVYGAVLLTFRLCRASTDLTYTFSTKHLSAVGDHTREFFLLSCLIYIAPVILTAMFEEYLVPLTPLLAAALAGNGSSRLLKCAALRGVLSVLLILGLAVFSICGTRD